MHGNIKHQRGGVRPGQNSRANHAILLPTTTPCGERDCDCECANTDVSVRAFVRELPRLSHVMNTLILT